MKNLAKSTVAVTITDHDRLYVEFAMGMSNEHFEKYAQLPRERRDYLFSLWVKRNYPNKVAEP